MPASECSNVGLWLKADIRPVTLRGLLSARTQTLADCISEIGRSTSAYRSEADVGDEIAGCLLLTPRRHREFRASVRDGRNGEEFPVTGDIS